MAIAFKPRRDVAVIANYLLDAVQIVDVSAGKIVRTIPLGSSQKPSPARQGEALFYVLSGHGQTDYKGVTGGLPSNKYVWKKNSLFAIPVDHYRGVAEHAVVCIDRQDEFEVVD